VQPFGLDPTCGTGGNATTTGFGGDRSSMALQSDGKVVLAGGTSTAFVLARFDVDGTLDDSFGTAGVVTGIAVGIANDVAIQPEGEIVIAGRAPWPSRRGTTSRICSSPGCWPTEGRTRESD
jgi:hypothetical protein